MCMCVFRSLNKNPATSNTRPLSSRRFWAILYSVEFSTFTRRCPRATHSKQPSFHQHNITSDSISVNHRDILLPAAAMHIHISYTFLIEIVEIPAAHTHARTPVFARTRDRRGDHTVGSESFAKRLRTSSLQ